MTFPKEEKEENDEAVSLNRPEPDATGRPDGEPEAGNTPGPPAVRERVIGVLRRLAWYLSGPGPFRSLLGLRRIGNPSCRLCVFLADNCCQDEFIQVALTPGDVERIAAATGRRDFFEDRAGCTPYYFHEEEEAWLRGVARDDGSWRVVRRSPGGGCLFFGLSGCSLDLSVRPLECRLYPVAFDRDGISMDSLYPNCRISREKDPRRRLAAMGMTEERLGEWHRMLYQELGAHGKEGQGPDRAE